MAVLPDTINRIIGSESGGNPYARNPRSSAAGPGQFINGTWLDMINKYRPDLAQGRTRDQILALRSDPQLSHEITGAYARENEGVIAAAGFQPTPGTAKLAHFAGPAGAVKALSADPSTPIAQVLSPEQLAANPFLAKQGINTAGDLVNWAHGQMGLPPTVATAAAAPGGSQDVAANPSLAAGQGSDANAPAGPVEASSVATAPAQPTTVEGLLGQAIGNPGFGQAGGGQQQGSQKPFDVEDYLPKPADTVQAFNWAPPVFPRRTPTQLPLPGMGSTPAGGTQFGGTGYRPFFGAPR